MAERPESVKTGSTSQPQLEEKIERKAQRKLRARREQARATWFWLGMFGLVGWSIAIPTVLGIVVGVWIDRHWPAQMSWTLTLLFLGVAVGCLHAWYWIKQEIKRK